MKNFKLILAATAILSASFFASSCKKGANDPFISFKSRDARLTGTWKLVGINTVNTSTTVVGVNVNKSESKTTYQNGIATTTTTPGGSTSNSKFDYQITFDKGGVYKSSTNNYNSAAVLTGTVESDGTWTWANDTKNKKNIQIVSLATEFLTQFTPAGAPTIIEVLQLKGKELVLKRAIRIKSGLPNSNSEQSIVMEMTFEAVK